MRVIIAILFLIFVTFIAHAETKNVVEGSWLSNCHQGTYSNGEKYNGKSLVKVTDDRVQTVYAYYKDKLCKKIKYVRPISIKNGQMGLQQINIARATKKFQDIHLDLEVEACNGKKSKFLEMMRLHSDGRLYIGKSKSPLKRPNKVSTEEVFRSVDVAEVQKFLEGIDVVTYRPPCAPEKAFTFNDVKVGLLFAH